MDKPKPEPTRKTGLSRRRFVNSAAAGAAGAALLASPAAAQLGSEEITAGMVPATLRINGRTHKLMVEPRWTLQYVLRNRLGLTGTKAACERGECGSCTVLIDGPLLLPHPGPRGRRKRDHHRRRSAQGRRARPRPTRLYRRGRLPVRLLHARAGDGHRGPAPQDTRAQLRRDPRRSQRQSVPLRSLQSHPQRRCAGRRA
jgi:hypothetical protein